MNRLQMTSYTPNASENPKFMMSATPRLTLSRSRSGARIWPGASSEAGMPAVVALNGGSDGARRWLGRTVPSGAAASWTTCGLAGTVRASITAATMVRTPVNRNGNAKPPPIAAPNAPMTGPSTKPPIWNAA